MGTEEVRQRLEAIRSEHLHPCEGCKFHYPAPGRGYLGCNLNVCHHPKFCDEDLKGHDEPTGYDVLDNCYEEGLTEDFDVCPYFEEGVNDYRDNEGAGVFPLAISGFLLVVGILYVIFS